MTTSTFAPPTRSGRRSTLSERTYPSLKKLFGLHLYWINSRTLPEVQPPAPPQSITIREMTRDELLQFTLDPELDLKPKALRGMASGNRYCFGALDGEKLVAYTWIALTTAPHPYDLEVRVNTPRCYGYKAFTRAEYRGRKIWPVLVQFAEAAARERGCDEALSYIELDNAPSLAAAKKINARRVGFAGYLRCFGQCFPFCSPGAKRAGFDLTRTASQRWLRIPSWLTTFGTPSR
jgi:GNAT superfamily N-acetyltransferase